jgi:hypothetical protein
MDEAILTEEELKRAVQKIFKLSQTDPAFRALCLTNPNEAIQTPARPCRPMSKSSSLILLRINRTGAATPRRN